MSGGSANPDEMRRLLARVATLEQLLEVYERSVAEQSDRLITERERLRFQTALLEAQGEATVDGILSVSGDGVVLFANRRLAEMWGIPPPRPGAKSWETLLRAMAARAAQPEDFLERATTLAAGGEGRDEVALADGRTFDYHTAPILAPEGTRLGRVWHFRDVSRDKEVARLKDEFISAVSHELRTPLTSIRAALDLIASGTTGALPPEAARLAAVAQDNCQRLGRLVNDVLDMEKIEAGRLDFEVQRGAVAPVLAEAVESMHAYGESLGVTFALEIEAPGAEAHLDRDRLRQVVENLLSNALRFSPRGGTVRVHLTRLEDEVRISVADEGPGIPHELRGRIFDRFTQGSAPAARRRGGSGLGLSIARAIVERLGGRIHFESEPGQGATFHVDLPARLEARTGA